MEKKNYVLEVDFSATITYEDGDYFFERKKKLLKNSVFSGKDMGGKIRVSVKEELEGYFYIPKNLVTNISF